MYWFLVARKDLEIALGDTHALKGLNIGAALGRSGIAGPVKKEGIDPDTGSKYYPIPGTVVPGVSFGVTSGGA